MKEGWTYKKLGKVCEVISGQSPDGKTYNNDGIGTPFYQGKKDFSLKFIGAPTTWTTQETKIAIKDDILMSVRAPVGDVNYATQRVCIGRGLAAIRPGEFLDKDFLFYFLLAEKKNITGKEGAVFPSINRKEIMDILISYPSINEQQRIVERLDAAFENIDKLKANAEKQLAEAQTLFQKSLAKAMEPKEGWEEKTLKDVADFVRGPFGGSLTKSMFKSEGYAVYEQQHAIHGHINIRYYIDSEKFKEMERFSVEAGDLIMSCSGVTLGRVNLLPSNTPVGIINQALLKMKVIKNTDARYFKFWLESVHFQKIIKEYSGGAAIPNVPAVKILKDIKISIPSLAEQQRIVERLDSLSENIRKYEEIQQQIISECDALKQALLRKVFE